MTDDRTAGAPSDVPPLLDAQAGRVLLAQARAAVAAAVGGPALVPPPWGPWSDLAAGSFVTLYREGLLRGCIGTVQDQRPLSVGVVANAVAAATRDPRFPPVVADELAAVVVEVSVLSPPRRMVVADRAEAAARLRPGTDGVMLRLAGRSAAYLPQVWAMFGDPDVFLAHLRVKAGLASEGWEADLQLDVFTVQEWSEHPPLVP
jgi:AmmeMemoRadiSam system protein A